jgi:hypothetical protein
MQWEPICFQGQTDIDTLRIRISHRSYGKTLAIDEYHYTRGVRDCFRAFFSNPLILHTKEKTVGSTETSELIYQTELYL